MRVSKGLTNLKRGLFYILLGVEAVEVKLMGFEAWRSGFKATCVEVHTLSTQAGPQ